MTLPSNALDELQRRLEYPFRKPVLLHQALVHRSYVHENPHHEHTDNETLEFLGDAVLGLSISHLLIMRFPESREGELSRLRSSIVNERELAKIAAGLGLGEYLLLGKGEEMTGGRHKPSLLADSLEALLGAVFLDGGLDHALEIVERLFHEYIDFDVPEKPLRALDKDFKTQLQELTQARFKLPPVYVLERDEGPDHEKTFFMSVAVGGRILAHGTGKSKKEAQQEAARKALGRIDRLMPETPR